MQRGKLIWKTEKLSEYAERVAKDTERTARQILVVGEIALQSRVRFYTPRETGRLWSSIEMDHHGRWESVRSVEGGLFGVPLGLPGVGGSPRSRELEGGVHSDLPWASDVEYDTGIYNKRNGGLPIFPKTGKALAFRTKSGKSIVVASVKGYPGKHMFSKGASYVSVSPTYLQRQSTSVLSRWRARNSIVRPR